MKKVLAWVLLLTLVLGAFAGCKQKPEPEVTEPPYAGAGAADAIEYLKGFYNDGGKKTPVDYTRFGIVRVGGVAFDVVWTVDVSEDLVKIVPNEDGTVTIDINEACEEDTEYTLIATVTDAQGNTATHSWTYVLPKGVDMVEVVKSAYALQPGESLPYESRLIGKIISIDAIWTEDYQNVTVTIEVEGAEDMPIKCYRMKANDSTIDAARNLKVGNIITVCGTLKNYEGTIEFDAGCMLEKVEKGDAIEAPTDPVQIVKEAYALSENATLPYQATLTGTVTGIDSPYDPQYGNISVVITIEGAEQYPILCYRLKGTGVDQIAINDLITVTGIIKNYRGTIEYDAGCVMTNRVSGGGVAQGPSSDPNKIIPDALKLAPGEKMAYRATLTGEVVSVDTPYDPGYGNVTVTMKVQGYKFQCYRMVGDGIDQIRETDTITVSGVIENYNDKLEFGAKCTLDSWVKGPRPVGYGPLKEDTAYRLYVDQKGIGKMLYFNGEYSGSRLSTSEKGSEGVDVFVERVSGKGVYFYFMDGQAKKYISVEDYTNDKGQVRGRTCVVDTPNVHWAYNSDLGVYLAEVSAGKHFMGAYNTYETISASWVGYIDGSMASSNQYVAKFMAASDVPADGPSQGGAAGEMVTEPEVGVPYKWGIEQENKGKTMYFTGAMSGYYGATSENIEEGVDVMLEAADGGYYITFKDASGAKKYVTVVVEAKDGKTYRNFTIANAPSTVYTYNSEYNTLVTNVDGDDCYMGTYDNFVTFSVSYFSKIDSSFPSHFYTVGEGGEPEVTEPTTPDVTEPSTGDGFNKITSAAQFTTGKYVMIVDTGYAPGVLDGKWVSAVQPVVSGNQVTDTKDAVWTLTVKGNSVVITDASGASIAPSGGNSNGITSGSYDWAWSFKNGKFVFAGTGSDTVYLASNTVTTGQYAGNHRFRGYKTSTVNGNPSTYPYEFTMYKLSGEYVEPEVTEPTTPDVTEPSGGEAGMVTAPEVGVAYKWGIEQENKGKTMYFTGAMSGYYGATSENIEEGVDVMLEAANGGYYITFKDASGAKKYVTVVVETKSGKTYRNFTIADAPSTVYTYNTEYNTMVTNVDGDDCYMGTHDNFVTFSVSYFSKIDSSFPSHFYTVGEGGEVEPEVTEPTTPDVTEPSGGEAGMVTAPEVGVAYKWGMEQNTLGKTLYFNGEMAKTYYGGTTENIGEAVDVMLEAADGGYYLTFKDASGAKKYITVVVSVNGTKTYRNFTIADKASTVYTWDAENNTLTTDVEGTICYIGTYNNFDTFSISTIDKIGTSFPSHFYTVGEGGEPEVTEPETTEPEETEPEVTEPVTGTGYVKVTDASQLTSGKYVLVVDGGYAPSTYASGWVNVVQPVVSGNQVTDTKGAVWTLTVSGNTVTITDANGVAIAPKGGNANGITNKVYQWAWKFQNGKFVFTGTGSDTVTLASNGNNTGSNPGNFRFRAYKNTTVSGQADIYPSQFTLYKLVG